MSRAHIITHHARKRFAERYVTAAELDALKPEVIDGWIDRLVSESEYDGRVEHVLDGDIPLRIVEIHGRRPGDPPLYACLKADQVDGQPVIMTILDSWMCDSNRRKRWTGPGGERLLAHTGRTKGLRAPMRRG